MRYNMLIVDGDDLLRRSDGKFSKLNTSRGQHSGALFGSIRSLFKMFKDHGPWYCMVFFDENPHLTARDLRDQREALREFLTLIGVDNKVRTPTDMLTYFQIAKEIETFRVLVASDEWPMADWVTDRIHWLYDKQIETKGESLYVHGKPIPALQHCLIGLEKAIPEKLTDVRDFLSRWEMRTIAQQLKIAM